jgi:GPH family glycoside/pentoside/hexuronide:cation symporter
VDLKSILRQRSWWCQFFYGLTAQAPMAMYYTAFLYYMDYVVDAQNIQATIVDVGSTAVVFLLFPLFGSMAKKRGTKFTYAFAVVPYIVGFTILYFSHSWISALASYACIISGKYIAATASAAYGAFVIDENELRTGTRKAGLFTAVNRIMGAPFASVQSIIFFSILGAGGFVTGDELAAQGNVQLDSAIEAIRTATCLVPIGFALLGIIPMLLMPYTIRQETAMSEWANARRTGEDVVIRLTPTELAQLDSVLNVSVPSVGAVAEMRGGTLGGYAVPYGDPHGAAGRSDPAGPTPRAGGPRDGETEGGGR